MSRRAPIGAFGAWLGALLAAAAPALAQPEQGPAEEDDPCPGHTVAGFELECDLDACQIPAKRAVFERILASQVSQPYSVELRDDAVNRFQRTGFFRTVRGLCTLNAEGGAVVRVEAVAHIVITNIEIVYADWKSRLYPKQFDSEIKKRMLLRKGGPFDPANEDFLDRQRQNILELYERSGYRGTTVSIGHRFDGPSGKYVTLTVTVDEGAQPWLRQVLVRGNKALGYSEVVGPLSTGERVDLWRSVFGLFGVGKYEKRQLVDELREVEQRYRDRDWYTARVRLVDVVDRGDEVYPRVNVHEGPKVELVFEGNVRLSREDLLAVCTFIETGAIDDPEIEETAKAIREAYQALAHYFVDVDWVRVPSGITGPDLTRIVFRINEGPRVYVRAVRILGNSRMRRDAILEAMQTKGIAEDGVISIFNSSPGVLQDTQMVLDLNGIRALYESEGFPEIRFRCRDARTDAVTWRQRRLLQRKGVENALTRGQLDVWRPNSAEGGCFMVELDRDPRLLTVTIQIAEGRRTTTDRLDLDAVLSAMSADMRDEAFDVLEQNGFVDAQRHWKRNVGLSQRKLESVRGLLLRWYRRQGYLAAKVVPDCGRSPDYPEGGRPCTDAELYGVDLPTVGFGLEPGPRTQVDGILLGGNLETRDRIIRKELLFSDHGWLGSEDLFLSQANLRSLGIFESVRVETVGSQVPSARARTDIRPVTVVAAVEEGQYQLFDGHLGLRIDSAPLSTSELPVLYVFGASIRDKNLFGTALELGLGGEHANRIDRPLDVSGDDAVWQIGPFLRERRFAGTKINLDMTAQYSLARTEQRDQYQAAAAVEATLSYDFFNLSYPRDWGRGLTAVLKTTYSRERLRDLIRQRERPPFGAPIHSVSIGPRLNWDRRDNPLHPTRGWLVSETNEAVLVVDEGTAALGRPSFKETLTGQYVQPFFERRLMIVPTLRFGAVQTRRAEGDLPGDFLFKSGGDAVLLPVRGYADASIEACGGHNSPAYCEGLGYDEVNKLPNAVGGHATMVGSIEARFPTFLFEDFWFAAFSDIGAVAPAWADLSADRFYPSVGLGLRWLVTGQIPLRLDFGVPLRETAFARREPRLHLNIFYTL